MAIGLDPSRWEADGLFSGETMSLKEAAELVPGVLNLRLVKGAYWDSEVKRAQERGLPGYPVYTRKSNTDVAYLACVRILLEGTRRVYPQFATHNAHTAASIIHLARRYGREFEFQRLHGMGEELYAELTDPDGRALPCRVYAPVGSHEELLPYLVRRLLENGANTSFVHQIADPAVPLEELVADPVARLPRPYEPHPGIPLPRDLFDDRRNSAGVDLARRDELDRLESAIRADRAQATSGVREPGNLACAVGAVRPTGREDLDGYRGLAWRGGIFTAVAMAMPFSVPVMPA